VGVYSLPVPGGWGFELLMVTVWFLVIAVNGLNFISSPPFKNEAACEIAAKLVKHEPHKCEDHQLDLGEG
jgi:hypothetical protein